MSITNKITEKTSQVAGYFSSFMQFLQVKNDDPLLDNPEEANDESQDDSRVVNLQQPSVTARQIIDSDSSTGSEKETMKVRPIEVVKPFITNVPKEIQEITGNQEPVTQEPVTEEPELVMEVGAAMNVVDVAMDVLPNIQVETLATKKKKRKTKSVKVAPKKVILPPLRETSRRKAKEKTNSKIALSLSQEGLESDYDLGDSDEDPAWSMETSIEGRQRKGLRRRSRHPRDFAESDDTSSSESSDIIPLSKKHKLILDHKQKTDTTPSNNKPNQVASTINLVTNKTVPSSKVDEPNTPKPQNSPVQTTPATQASSASNNAVYTSEEEQIKPGEYVVLKEDLDKKHPPIWRLDGKTLLQKYEPFEQGGEMLYRNLTTFSGWTSTIRSRYLRAPIKFRIQNRKEIVVEFIQEDLVIDEKDCFDDDTAKEMKPLRDDFEVYVQTLISQALDPNFLTEIFNEEDEFFLSSIKKIENLAEKRKSNLQKLAKWKEDPLKGIHTWPSFRTSPAGKDQLCAACEHTSASVRMELSGQPYCNSTLQDRQPSSDAAAFKEFPVCAVCFDRLQLYHKVCHLKHSFFAECCRQVAEKKGVGNREILNEMLTDETWLNKAINSLQKSLTAIDDLDRSQNLREIVAKKYKANKPAKR